MGERLESCYKKFKEFCNWILKNTTSKIEGGEFVDCWKFAEEISG